MGRSLKKKKKKVGGRKADTLSTGFERTGLSFENRGIDAEAVDHENFDHDDWDLSCSCLVYGRGLFLSEAQKPSLLYSGLKATRKKTSWFGCWIACLGEITREGEGSLALDHRTF